MKQIYSCFLALLAFSGLNAQITITQDDMPISGMQFTYSNCLMNANDQSTNGENIVWDYSDLEEINQTEDSTINISEASSIFQLVFNNGIIFPDHLSDFYTAGVEFDFGGLTVEDVSDFFNVSANAYEQTGFGASLNGIPVAVIYDPKDVIYNLPLNFGDATLNNSFFEVEIPTFGYWSGDITRTNQVEGWGSLILPDGEYETLKVKTVIDRSDSLFVDLISFGSSIPYPTVTEYKWLDSGSMLELLIITEVLGQVTTVQYLNDPDVVSSIDDPNFNSFNLYPNPSQNQIFFSSTDVLKRIVLFDLVGKKVMELKSETGIVYLDIEDLEKGAYIIQLNGSQTETIIKQ